MIAFLMGGLILTAIPISLLGFGDIFANDPLLTPATTKIGNAIKGYSIGLAIGLVPPFIPLVGTCIIMGLAGSPKMTADDYIAGSFGTAGVLSGLYVWYSAISYWKQ